MQKQFYILILLSFLLVFLFVFELAPSKNLPRKSGVFLLPSQIAQPAGGVVVYGPPVPILSIVSGKI